ncbi:MAG: hypothetical protein HN712_25435 [Gemmatimonadetes bacterium]|jgi:dienelactone hydrolase/pimeloyl-ACP methyl ester carboxylesterase|nr:hypothetical protein [Gemmatimonadota bacterium]MBT7863685.1 hypothetical protein [Gemmatimonadota bacterium]
MMSSGYGHMVHDDFVERVRSMREERQAQLAGIRTKAQAQGYQRRVRKAIRQAFGPRPAKTPLNTQVTGVVETRHCRIEKLLFESRPGCLVTAHLYVPNKLDGKAPAVLGTCGHSADGKLEPKYQGFCQRLARNGYVVLIYDPFNQGERDQYQRLPDRSAVGNCCHAHNMMGKQLELVGEWFGMWRTWDGVRALDVLLARPEVDRTRVGLTGNSGGGTMTQWLWATEPRFTMAAPSCFVTTFLNNLENELPADCEQYPPGVLGAGLEMADFYIARAPDPVMLLGQKYCFFDRRGLKEAYDEVRNFYKVLGAPAASTQLFIGGHPHGFFEDNQEAMVGFFAETAHTTAKKVRQVDEIDAEAGNVTPTGNTVDAGATPIYELIASQAQMLAEGRKKLTGPALRRTVTELLHLPDRAASPHYRVLRSRRVDGETCARYAVETGPGHVRAIMHKILVDGSRAQTLDVETAVHLHLPHVDASTECADKWVAQTADGRSRYLLDVRGLGESMPDEAKENFFHPYGMDYMFHGHELLFGESWVGKRVHDVLATIDLLVTEGASRVTISGHGQGAVLAAYAALLHDGVGAVTLKGAPLSYQAMAQAPLVSWPASNFVRNCLAHFDLPDVYRALGRRLTLTEPWDVEMKPLRGARLKRALAVEGLVMR